jgi:hypothetical protein
LDFLTGLGQLFRAVRLVQALFKTKERTLATLGVAVFFGAVMLLARLFGNNDPASEPTPSPPATPTPTATPTVRPDYAPLIVLLCIAVVASIAVIAFVRYRRNRINQAAASVKSTVFSRVNSTASRGTSAKGRCPDCQHVQTVPVNVSAYECEQCHAKLRRPTEPIELA